MSSKKCLTRVSHKSVKQECLTRALRNSVKQGRPTRVSHQCVNSGCLTSGFAGNVTNKYCLCLSTYVSAFGFVGFILFFLRAKFHGLTCAISLVMSCMFGWCVPFLEACKSATVIGYRPRPGYGIFSDEIRNRVKEAVAGVFVIATLLHSSGMPEIEMIKGCQGSFSLMCWHVWKSHGHLNEEISSGLFLTELLTNIGAHMHMCSRAG